MSNHAYRGGELLEREIAARKITKSEAAKMCGMHQSRISYFLHGRRLPTLTQAGAMLDALGIPMRSWLP